MNKGLCISFEFRKSFEFVFIIAGYFHYDKPHGPCEACDCHPVGAVGQVCAADTGQCVCANSSLAGRKCDRCQELYFGFNHTMGRLVVHCNYLPQQQDENSPVEAKRLHTPKLKIFKVRFSQFHSFHVASLPKHLLCLY